MQGGLGFGFATTAACISVGSFFSSSAALYDFISDGSFAYASFAISACISPGIFAFLQLLSPDLFMLVLVMAHLN